MHLPNKQSSCLRVMGYAGQHGAGRIGLLCTEASSRFLLQELYNLERRVVKYGRSNLEGLENVVQSAFASVVDMRFPTARWPVYVFTAGAMVRGIVLLLFPFSRSEQYTRLC